MDEANPQMPRSLDPTTDVRWMRQIEPSALRFSAWVRIDLTARPRVSSMPSTPSVRSPQALLPTPHAPPDTTDDIYYLEICLINEICENGADVFKTDGGQAFRCKFSDTRFRALQEIPRLLHLLVLPDTLYFN